MVVAGRDREGLRRRSGRLCAVEVRWGDGWRGEGAATGARRKRSKYLPRCADDGDDDDAGKGWHAAVVVEGHQGPEHGCEEAAHCGACCCAVLVRSPEGG